jgi:hypothetical protein
MGLVGSSMLVIDGLDPSVEQLQAVGQLQTVGLKFACFVVLFDVVAKIKSFAVLNNI